MYCDHGTLYNVLTHQFVLTDQSGKDISSLLILEDDNMTAYFRNDIN